MKQQRIAVWSFVVAVLALPAWLAAETPSKRPFLWKIESPTGIAYLFGSLHAARPEIYPLDERVYRAFDSSGQLAVEADMSSGKTMIVAGQMLARAMYKDGDSADKHLPRKLFEEASARLAKFGLPAAQFKPWYQAMTLTMMEIQTLGMRAENGLDVHFLARAKQKIIPVVELEGAEFQMNMLDGMTDKEQELFLAYTIKDLDDLPKYMKELEAAWTTGDDQRLDTLLRDSLKEMPEAAPLYKKLFDDRNVKMAEKVEEYLKTGKTTFVVVGAGHLVGETGLIRTLGKKYKVTQP